MPKDNTACVVRSLTGQLTIFSRANEMTQPLELSAFEDRAAVQAQLFGLVQRFLVLHDLSVRTPRARRAREQERLENRGHDARNALRGHNAASLPLLLGLGLQRLIELTPHSLNLRLEGVHQGGQIDAGTCHQVT